MALCPVCNTPGAYVGFTAVECRNPDCVHFKVMLEETCPCCGQTGHTASPHNENCDPADVGDPSSYAPGGIIDPAFAGAPPDPSFGATPSDPSDPT